MYLKSFRAAAENWTWWWRIHVPVFNMMPVVFVAATEFTFNSLLAREVITGDSFVDVEEMSLYLYL